jgi:predicted ATP-binding protein involved in virulence
MLDEVELYFHPDFQKRIVTELLAGISHLSIPNIKSLNILFSTHSPFILSDIPKRHVLAIDDGHPLPAENETFGANIHDLLADSFY